jgi:hypothetical protein
MVMAFFCSEIYRPYAMVKLQGACAGLSQSLVISSQSGYICKPTKTDSVGFAQLQLRVSKISLLGMTYAQNKIFSKILLLSLFRH